jgi:poly(3-hydroxybutyrate) depolymerase
VTDSLCPATSEVSVLEVHGNRDSQIAYDGSGGPSSRDVVESWGGRNGCSGRLASTGTTMDIEADIAGAETAVARVAGCPPGVAAELWTVQGGDHHPNLISPAWGDAVIGWLLSHPKP